jgi:hypothetical protein
MTIRTHYLAAAAAIGVLAVPAAAQTAYPAYQQQYPQYQQQAYPGYGQPSYGGQGYSQNPVGQIINQLLGNRYNVTDRTAVSQCATAAMTQAAAQYGNGYNQGYANNGYNRGYNGAMRVTSITEVKRRNSGLRVSGLMSSPYVGQHGQSGYQGQQYAQGDVSFRCNVDYRGQVTNVRIGRNNTYRG